MSGCGLSLPSLITLIVPERSVKYRLPSSLISIAQGTYKFSAMTSILKGN
ncbi:hypothetical protein J2Z43_000758 [Clostridioides mangenotii]|uniref:Uncharacterized protein n=1 Tax=Metaclostridioides mangenotii TaxID=1540 RepID=A0ABS4E8X2_9FIRM|nr:hypothetical protein [Clostridioides mangenotii]